MAKDKSLDILIKDLRGEVYCGKKEIKRLEEVVKSWKDWHREIALILDTRFVERKVTLAAIKKIVDDSKDKQL